MDISSMMSAAELHKSSHQVASGLAAQRGNGLSTPATGTLPKAASAGPASAAGASTSSSNDITSNDFLTLLVTEMQNQDPTQPTDPNAYIQQLVGVNSLQQLISINQELGAATGTASSSTGSVRGASGAAAAASPKSSLPAFAATAAPTNTLLGS